jgi:hypothetical protein
LLAEGTKTSSAERKLEEKAINAAVLDVVSRKNDRVGEEARSNESRASQKNEG